MAWHLHDRQIGFSLGMQIDQHVREAIGAQPDHAWTPTAGHARGEVCELTGWLELGS